MEKVSLKIHGMSCDHCVRAVQSALEEMEGVELERVEVGSASVRFDPERTDAVRIARAIEEAGYPVSGPASDS